MNLNEILAYKQIKNFSKEKISLNSLEKLCTKCNDPIFSDLKVYMILSLKWHFSLAIRCFKSNREKQGPPVQFN